MLMSLVLFSFGFSQVLPRPDDERCVILSLDASRLETWLNVFAGGQRRLRLWQMEQKFTKVTYDDESSHQDGDDAAIVL